MWKFKTKNTGPVRKVLSMTVGTAVFVFLSHIFLNLIAIDEPHYTISVVICSLLSALFNYWIGFMTTPSKDDGIVKVRKKTTN